MVVQKVDKQELIVGIMQPVAFPTFFIGILLHDRDKGIGNQTLPLSSSGSKGSEGTHPVLEHPTIAVVRGLTLCSM